MYPKVKAWITTTTFLLIVFGFTFSFFICPDAGLSVSERRKLKQLPEINKESLTNGKFFDEFEEYMQDQFPARESLRTFKASAELFLFMKADNNAISTKGMFASRIIRWMERLWMRRQIR